MGVWTHAEKPRRKYRIRRHPERTRIINADPAEELIPETEIFTLV